MEPVADFLSGFSPFDELAEEELEGLAAAAEVEYFAARTSVIL